MGMMAKVGIRCWADGMAQYRKVLDKCWSRTCILFLLKSVELYVIQ